MKLEQKNFLSVIHGEKITKPEDWKRKGQMCGGILYEARTKNLLSVTCVEKITKPKEIKTSP